jgi:ABC-type glutathione transport system ATPase component
MDQAVAPLSHVADALARVDDVPLLDHDATVGEPQPHQPARLQRADEEIAPPRDPELLLLDEPSEGLAPIVVDHLREQIARLKGEG